MPGQAGRAAAPVPAGAAALKGEGAGANRNPGNCYQPWRPPPAAGTDCKVFSPAFWRPPPMAVKNVEDAQAWESEVLKSPVPVFVDFWAEWCGPCRMVGPVVDELSGEYGDSVKFVKVNVDKANEIASRYSVYSIPTMAVFRDGKIVTQQVGAASKDSLKSTIDSAIA